MYVKFYEFEKKLFNFLCTHAFQCFTFCCCWELERIKSSEQWESKFTIFSLITICKNSNHTGLDKSLYKPYNLQTLDKTEWIWVQTYWLKNGYLNVCMFACFHRLFKHLLLENAIFMFFKSFIYWSTCRLQRIHFLLMHRNAINWKYISICLFSR